MLLAALLSLQALHAGAIRPDASQAIRAFFLPPGEDNNLPLIVSSFLDEEGHPLETFETGQTVWLRLSSLSGQGTAHLLELVLPSLPPEIILAGVRWQVKEIFTRTEQHPWAGQGKQADLVGRHLLNLSPPHAWRVTFASPVSFQRNRQDAPLPSPRTLVEAWTARWLAFGQIALPEGLVQAATRQMEMTHRAFRTVPWGRGRLACVGSCEIHAPRMKVTHRAGFDLLGAFAFFAGSGPQGEGLTLCEPLTKVAPASSENWWLGGQEAI